MESTLSIPELSSLHHKLQRMLFSRQVCHLAIYSETQTGPMLGFSTEGHFDPPPPKPLPFAPLLLVKLGHMDTFKRSL